MRRHLYHQLTGLEDIISEIIIRISLETAVLNLVLVETVSKLSSVESSLNLPRLPIWKTKVV